MNKPLPAITADQVAPGSLADHISGSGVIVSGSKEFLHDVERRYAPMDPTDFYRHALDACRLPSGDEINALAESIHADNRAAGWWNDLATGEPLKRNVGELLMLVFSELCEGADGLDFDLMDDKLPHRLMIEVELADAVIRIYDIGGGFDLDLGGTAEEIIGMCLFADDPDVTDSHRRLFNIARDLSAAMEGDRKKRAHEILMDRSAFAVGVARALLGIYRMAALHGYDLAGAIVEKREFNRHRLDHQIANRKAEGGKAY